MKGSAPKRFGFFSKIETVEHAARAIKEVSYTLYALAGLTLLIGIFAARTMVFEAIFLALFGFLLQSSMSRCVAVIIGLYAILVAFLTIAAKAGVYRGTGGTNVVLAAILVYTAWRGVYAAVLYQRSRNARASVKNVVILTVLSLALTAVIGLVIIVVAIASGYGTRLRRECEMVVRESHPTSTSRELYVRQCIDDRAKSAR